MELPLYSSGTPGGPRVLLVHGLNGDAATWWRVADAFEASGCHVHSVDLRGHGAAARDDDLALASYAADLPGTDWDLVLGHSLGAATASIAATTPGFARRLALLDPVLEIDPASRDAIIADQLAELELTVDSLTAEKPHWHPRDVATKVAAARLSSPGTARGSFDDNPAWDAVTAVAGLEIPTLVLSGDPAVYTMLGTATVAAITRPALEYRVIPGTGHSPQRDDFDATMAVLWDWLSRSPEPSGRLDPRSPRFSYPEAPLFRLESGYRNREHQIP
ncbi:alpha/beta hydrolase [Glaciihabitans arcticus]|uniref:Alpha/beta hydrolase n=1 Tax=Glaciihabitans arcticus TaxID=2668039 RepID=A0A4Q9GTM5_9MICO|nr:alpha/beta hydrolase [Glaciihabitans arcticus]TBN57524.1 alpha/beta hydrolase [Glaciihabitans arcticus]